MEIRNRGGRNRESLVRQAWSFGSKQEDEAPIRRAVARQFREGLADESGVSAMTSAPPSRSIRIVDSQSSAIENGRQKTAPIEVRIAFR